MCLVIGAQTTRPEFCRVWHQSAETSTAANLMSSLFDLVDELTEKTHAHDWSMFVPGSSALMREIHNIQAATRNLTVTINWPDKEATQW